MGEKQKIDVHGFWVFLAVGLIVSAFWSIIPGDVKDGCSDKGLTARPVCVLTNLFM